MPEPTNIPLNFTLINPDLDREELEALTRTVQTQLKKLTEKIESQSVVTETYDDKGAWDN
jgi:hypothetical protein